MGTFTKLSGEIEEIKKSIREKALNEFKPALKEFVAAVKAEAPTVEKIRWTQYTPHFNDGDACEFRVNSPSVLVTGAEEDEGDYEDGYVDTYSGYDPEKVESRPLKELYGLNSLVKRELLTPNGAKLLADFSDELETLEDLCEIAFGDHAQVTIDVATGEVEVEEHEHD